jgi:hypothetical protein
MIPAMPGLHFEHYTADALTIRMQSLPADCWVCGSPDATGLDCGIPIYEDLILPNDWQGEWGGAPACPQCFELQNRLTEPLTRKAFLATTRKEKR